MAEKVAEKLTPNLVLSAETSRQPAGSWAQVCETPFTQFSEAPRTIRSHQGDESPWAGKSWAGLQEATGPLVLCFPYQQAVRTAHNHLGLLWLDAAVPMIVWVSDKAPGNPFQVWSVTGEGLAASQFLPSPDWLGGELGWGGTCCCGFRDLTRHRQSELVLDPSISTVLCLPSVPGI